jgi:hypothetical protein
MSSVLDHISEYAEFYGALAVIAFFTPLLVILTRSQVAGRHQTGLIVGMGIGGGPGGSLLMLGFLYGIAFSPRFALGMVILLMPFLVVPAFVGGAVGVVTSSLIRRLRHTGGQAST